MNTYLLRLVASITFFILFPSAIHATTLNSGDSGQLSGTVDYDNSDFIEINTVGAGVFTVTITPDNNDMDLDCGLTTSIGPKGVKKSMGITPSL